MRCVDALCDAVADGGAWCDAVLRRAPVGSASSNASRTWARARREAVEANTRPAQQPSRVGEGPRADQARFERCAPGHARAPAKNGRYVKGGGSSPRMKRSGSKVSGRAHGGSRWMRKGVTVTSTPSGTVIDPSLCSRTQQRPLLPPTGYRRSVSRRSACRKGSLAAAQPASTAAAPPAARTSSAARRCMFGSAARWCSARLSLEAVDSWPTCAAAAPC